MDLAIGNEHFGIFSSNNLFDPGAYFLKSWGAPMLSQIENYDGHLSVEFIRQRIRLEEIPRNL